MILQKINLLNSEIHLKHLFTIPCLLQSIVEGMLNRQRNCTCCLHWSLLRVHPTSFILRDNSLKLSFCNPPSSIFLYNNNRSVCSSNCQPNLLKENVLHKCSQYLFLKIYYSYELKYLFFSELQFLQAWK